MLSTHLWEKVAIDLWEKVAIGHHRIKGACTSTCNIWPKLTDHAAHAVRSTSLTQSYQVCCSCWIVRFGSKPESQLLTAMFRAGQFALWGRHWKVLVIRVAQPRVGSHADLGVANCTFLGDGLTYARGFVHMRILLK